MGKIIQLDKNLANQISAGEVVERPLSVVKELVENSIDAGATSIKVELREGGIDEIIITDNGAGIEKRDLLKATQKYTTSKIKTLADLHNVMTFGFRGEALASIASVSELKLISKTADQDRAWSISINGGEESGLQQDVLENGTRVLVKNLFGNTPARLNYLKKPRTEYGHILNFVQQVSLVYPEIGFECIHDGKNSLRFSKNQDIQARIFEIYGAEFAENILPIVSEFAGIKLSGYISDPKISFPNKNRQVLSVNKRIITSPIVYRAILNAYNRFIPHGTFPGYILNLDIDPTQVDVNVHPRKLEVRFADESTVFRSFFHAIEDKLNNVSLNSHASQDIDPSALSSNFLYEGVKTSEPQKQYYTGSGTKFKAYSPYKDTTPNPAQAAIDFTKAVSGDSPSLSTNFSTDLHDTPLGKIIGQFHNSYILVETLEGVQILDQHALAERIIYEKLVKQHDGHTVQGLLLGENIDLTPGEADILSENREVFSEIGFDLEIISGNSVLISSIPDFIKKESIKEIFLGILSDIGEQNFKNSKTLQEVKNKIFAYASCRAAIKFGHKLNLFEMNKLLGDAVLDYSATCPHGRPVIYEIDLEELKNKYER
ncbi:DNA mismatch repair endonuclease MutL [Candidatus Gracilibacteria bacterium]|nr:DNA mismatch repair endonuclease MutL [Candidatus Gracilibacteria bacterium]